MADVVPQNFWHLATTFRVETSHGAMAARTLGEGPSSVVFLHGNSWCNEVFRGQFVPALLEGRRLIAIDLPGHGLSEDAPDPARTYSRVGLADACMEALARADISNPTVVGWSLGGHIAIEMLARSAQLRALALVGTPPVPKGGMALGFKGGGPAALAGRAEFSEAEARQFAHATLGDPVDEAMLAAIRRTDRRFRPGLLQGIRDGVGADQKEAIERFESPVAVLNGARDSIVNLDYLDSIAFRRLWRDKCHRLPDAAHAPFWDAADSFNGLLAAFLDEVEGAGHELAPIDASSQEMRS